MKQNCEITKIFIHEWTRMCTCYPSCDGCPIHDSDSNICELDSLKSFDESEKILDIVQKWSDEHPEKTYKDIFLERFPNVSNEFAANIIDEYCPGDFFGKPHPKPIWDPSECMKQCRDCMGCWNRPYKEVKTDVDRD